MKHSEGTRVSELEPAHGGIKISRKAQRQLRQLLLGAAVGGAMIAAPQVANAAVHSLTGAQITTQTVTTDLDPSVVVNTDNTFNVNATIGDALTISGAGSITYDDLGNNNTLSTTAVLGNGLSITSTADNGVTPGSVTVVSGGTISGGLNGILATNLLGTGGISVTTTGGVSGGTGAGILVTNTNPFATGDVTVDTSGVSSISGDLFGIQVANAGTGATSVTSTNTVTSDLGDGINVVASNVLNTTDVIVEAADVSGAINGISATSAGTGGVSVTTTGDVTGGAAGAGIFVTNTNALATGDVKVDTSGMGTTVSGGLFGIQAINLGLGATSITSTNTVTSDLGDGINVLASVTGNTNPVTVEVADVTGAINGIIVENDGSGDTTITATGTVGGTTGDGINVLAANNGGLGAGNLTVEALNVTGVNGIFAQNDGTGDTTITATGTVVGTTGDGINVLAANNGGLGAGNLTVEALNVIGVNGIVAENDGSGDTTVTATGTVTGTAGDGINVLAAGDLTITAFDVTGDINGIYAEGDGYGTISVTTNGDVQGGTAGVDIVSGLFSAPTTLTINSGSVVHNSSGDTADLAIQISGASGGIADIVNDGTIEGNVLLGPENDTLTNNDIWNNTGGTSDFGAGVDVFNNDGAFVAANATGTSTTTVSGIDTVNNTGVIIMQNTDLLVGGGTPYVGDSLTFTNGGSGVFNADGGTLYVDTDIATQTSDVLNVDNVIGGTTGVDVNVVDGLGLPTTGDGILIVNVDGTSSPDAFALNSSITAGLYDYQLNEGETDPSWFLQSAVRPEVVATAVLPVLGSRTALSTMSNLHDRQRDENTLSNDAESRKGIWGRVFGQSNDFNANDVNDFGFESNVWGVQAGLDLMASGDDQGNRKYAGLYVAYASGSGDARQFDSKVASLDLNATTIGAYYTKYSSSNWYLDLVAQYSMLGGVHAKTATDDISPSGKSYALSLEAGQQFHPDSSIVREVQAQLIYQYTDMDNVTLNDDTPLELSSLNAVTGRFGLRLYGNPKSGKSFLPWLRANIWHTFSGDSKISSLGSSINTPIGGTSGELEIGFSKGNSQNGGWGFYGSAGYLFDISGAEYSGWKGTLGLRKGW